MAATPEPTPEVGEVCYTCRGAHTSVFVVPLTGLPPNTPVEVKWSVTGRGGGDYTDTATTDASGAVKVRRAYRDTGQPVFCRTVTVSSVQTDPPLGEVTTLDYSEEFCCPGGSTFCAFP